MGMAVRVFGLKEKKRNRQIIIMVRGQNSKRAGREKVGKEKERRKKRGRK